MGSSALDKFNARMAKTQQFQSGKTVEKEVEEEKVEKVVENGYFKFHENSDKEHNPHYFLGEELLVPMANSSDTQRLNMFANHINQMVHLKNPEFPKVFTNFEDQVGEYSVAYKKAEGDFEIIAKVVKNEYNYDLIIRYTSGKHKGVYDIIHYHNAVNITEDYGYELKDCIADRQVGDKVMDGDFIYKSTNYDEDGNYSYGVNLKAVYLCYKNLTYEDGIVITESAAKKLMSYKVEKTMFTINGNDILLNLYGDNLNYKAIPHVGDYVDSKVLVASRRHDKRTALYELQTGKMQHIDPDNDEIIYTSGGKVVDIDVFSNKSLEELCKSENKMFNSELISIIRNNHRYWTELATELEKIIPCKYLTEEERNKEKSEFGHFCKHPIEKNQNPNEYTDELAYYWKLAHEYIDEKIQWRYDGKSFDNFRIQFTILKENPLTPSCKITNRYGGKGVITSIIPDEEAPVNEYGERAEIILNSLGIINRMNLSTLKEHYINFMSDHVLRLMKATDNYEEKSNIFFSYLKEINKKEYDFYDIEYTMMNRGEREKFIDDIEKDGIYIHETPFFENTSMEQFKKIFKEHPEWCTEYKFEGIEKPLTMGDIYFIRLKHDFSNKTSLRSAANLNVKNLPAKSALKKEKKVLYSNNPLRLGEMEVTNLMLARRPDLVEKLLKTYSTNESLREQTISQLLDPGKTPGGHIKNTLNMNLEVDTKNNRAISREILDKYLNVLGYAIEDNDNNR